MSGTTDVRVEAVENYYKEGMRISTLSDATSPWVRAGITALENGQKVTPELLNRADSAQVMASPERTAS